MNTYLKALIAVVVVIGGAGGYWYYTQHTQEVLPPVQVDDIAEASSSAAAIQYPLPAAEPTDESTPQLDGSDGAIQASLENLFGATGLQALLIPTQIIQHIVATVDNLPRDKLAVSKRPISATSGIFAVSGDMTEYTLDTRNYARYKPVMLLVQMSDVSAVARWYREHYPLFQGAYENLGYPDGYFNDRLVQAIDDLLDTPEISEPIYLTQPKVFYEFADPTLEARSAGQKTLLRMGPDNTRIIKAKLRELRTAVTQ